jgi:hypothetical protein
MKSAYRFISLGVLSALLITACDQTEASFPDYTNGSGGECGSWYPGSDVDGGSSSSYAVAEGETFPCFVWESARLNHTSTWINVGELFLGGKYGAIDAKAIVIPVTGSECSGCYELIQAFAARKAEFESAAVMMAICHGGITAETPFSLEEAEATLIEQDGWPADWLLTNDIEEHFPIVEYQGLPWMVVVRLSDMKVMVRSNMDYSAANVGELLAEIQTY